MKNAIYLCKLHTRWIANYCPIRLCVPSILDQLRVPYPEVLFRLFPLWEDGNDRSQVPAISCVFQVFLEDFKHFSRGRHVTSVEYLVRRSLQRISDGPIWLVQMNRSIFRPLFVLKLFSKLFFLARHMNKKHVSYFFRIYTET